MPKAGLEPAQLSPLPPQDSVSTNSTTSAHSKNSYKDATMQNGIVIQLNFFTSFSDHQKKEQTVVSLFVLEQSVDWLAADDGPQGIPYLNLS